MTVIAIAIIGTLVFNFVSVPPAVAFAIGVVITALTIHFMPDPQPSQNSTDSTDSAQSSKTIYVGNLPYRANENDVKNLFAEHGEVFAVRLMKDKRTGKRRGFGFVVMNSQDADTAIHNLNNKEYGQRTLKIREANEPKSLEDQEIE